MVKRRKKGSITNLMASVVIDVLGYATYTIPVIGEVGDIIWAPVSAMLVYSLYGDSVFAAINFIEEITTMDVIPTATLAWVYFRLGVFPARR